jgi:hypothetical protein
MTAQLSVAKTTVTASGLWEVRKEPCEADEERVEECTEGKDEVVEAR